MTRIDKLQYVKLSLLVLLGKYGISYLLNQSPCIQICPEKRHLVKKVGLRTLSLLRI